MSSVDDRVVEMKFNNAEFERGVRTTLNSLESLNKGLKLQGATKGLDDVSKAAHRFSLGSLIGATKQAEDGFNQMKIIAATALATIAHQATLAGERFVKSFTFGPIIDGLHEYETTLNSVQTILSNTQWQGATMKQVNDALQQLNTYSDKTIYNFGQMARNIGTFTAAGVKLDTSVAAIKGIANLAAVSGSNADQASTAMYQLSQALATGTVKLMDWNSVVNAGMGGKVFQDALKETARAHGVAIDAIIKKQGSFRDSLKTGWLSSDILTETLSKFTGDMTASQLKQMGYTDKQIAGILKMGKTAQDAATKVKTFSQLLGTLKEAAGSGWAQTWQLVIGDFEEAKSLWTNVNNVLGGAISASANARNKVLGDWKKLGGRTALIDSFSNAFHALISVLKPIRDAFREIFPEKTGKDLYNMTVALRDFTAKLKMGADGADKLKRIFSGVFAIFDIGWQIIKQVAKTFAHLFGVAKEGSGGIVDVLANIGDFFVKLDNAIKNGDKLTTFFQKLGDILALPIKGLQILVSWLTNVGDAVPDAAVDRLETRFSALGALGHLLVQVWSHVTGFMKNAYQAFKPLADMFHKFFSSVGEEITKGLADVNYSQALDTINTGLFAVIAFALKRFLKNGLSFKLDTGTGGVLDSIKQSFDGLTGTMKAMQAQLKANTLLRIAGAIALLTASVVALSLIDSKKLTKALTAITVMFTQLMVSMALFDKIGATKGFLKMPFVTSSMILLAIAVDMLAIAVGKLAGLSWNELAKGLTGVTVLIVALAGSAKMISANAGGMVRAGAGLLLLSVGIRVLASAVTELSGLSWQDMAKGLVGVGTLLASLAIFTKLVETNKAGVLQGAGLILLAAGIKILASAVGDFGGMNWGEIAKGLVSITAILAVFAGFSKVIGNPVTLVAAGASLILVATAMNILAGAMAKFGNLAWGEIAKGLVTMAGALTIIALALNAMPPSTVLSAAAVLVVATSLGMLATALKDMSGMSWGEIAKGLVTLAGALGIIALAMIGMTGTLAGAAALFVVASALRIFVPVLSALGKMSWRQIGKGLVTLAASLAVLGLAGLLLQPVIPALLGLGAAIVLLGAGVALAGVGVLAFSIGLTALAASGAAAAGALVGIIQTLLGALPMIIDSLAIAIIALAKGIAAAAPEVVKAIVVVLEELMKAIVRLTPQIVTTLFTMITSMLAGLRQNMPKITQAGLDILISLLKGISKNIGRIVNVVTDITVRFLNALGKNLPRIIQAGFDFIISFLHGIAKAIEDNSEEMGAAGADIGIAIVKGMVKGIEGAAHEVIQAAKDLAKHLPGWVKKVLHIDSPSKVMADLGMYSALGLAKGIDDYSHVVGESSKEMGRTAISTLKKSLSGMASIDGHIEINPTIKPVLDLSAVAKDSSKLSSMISAKPISVGSSYSSAKNAAEGYSENQIQVSKPQLVSKTPDLTFIQNNTSPKALSEAEIYRQTRNQISVAKGVLTRANTD